MQSFFRKHAPNDKGPYGISSEVMDTYVKSCGELQFVIPVVLYLALLIICFFINHYLHVLNHDVLFSGLLCHHLHPRCWRQTSRQFTSHKDWYTQMHHSFQWLYALKKQIGCADMSLWLAGKLFHIDFGYILGRDPKPLPPPMKLSKEMVEGMGGMQSEQYQEFRKQCYTAFLHLRRWI